MIVLTVSKGTKCHTYRCHRRAYPSKVTQLSMTCHSKAEQVKPDDLTKRGLLDP